MAITGLLLMVMGMDADGATTQTVEPEQIPDTVSIIEQLPIEDVLAGQAAEPEAGVRADTLVSAAREEARRTVRNLWYGFLSNLPKFVVALGVMLFAWVAV